MARSRIRVLIADDEAALRAALADLIESDDAFELVGAASDTEEAIALAEATNPDVALIDVRMPGGGGLRVAERLRHLASETRVLALSAVDDRATVVRMLESGAVGYLVKGTAPDEILAAIAHAARGQPSVSPDLMTGLVRDLADQLDREETATSERLAKVARISRVIEGDGISMVYQPIVELEGHRGIGMEALARFAEDGEAWTIPQWFSAAAEVGLGTELELACNRAALADLATIPPDRYLSINVSHRTAESDGLIEVLDTVDASRVVIEITEHEPVDDYDRLTRSLKRVRERGARVAIDDAGAGFASLRHILRIDPEIIKLDISLTSGIDSDARRRALATALISFAEEMSIAVVAEGIETELEHTALRRLGVRFGQGYFIGRPEALPGWTAGRLN